MQNFDVQLNLLLVNKPLLVVLTMCSALFSTFCAEFVSNVANALATRFSSIFHQHFVEHCQRFYNGLNNITNALRTIINAL